VCGFQDPATFTQMHHMEQLGGNQEMMEIHQYWELHKNVKGSIL
jgi:hypothetical protein